MSATSLHAGLALEAKRKEIYTYQAPWLIYGMNWSVRPDQKFRLAIGSFEEECVLYLRPRARRAAGRTGPFSLGFQRLRRRTMQRTRD